MKINGRSCRHPSLGSAVNVLAPFSGREESYSRKKVRMALKVLALPACLGQLSSAYLDQEATATVSELGRL